VIVLDTHAWIWWINDHPRLNRTLRDRLDSETDVRVSAISLLEVATAVSVNRLHLACSTQQWLELAQCAIGLTIEPITSELAIASTTLPGEFHRDPADRLIVALARLLDCELATADAKILQYSHVKTVAAE